MVNVFDQNMLRMKQLSAPVPMRTGVNPAFGPSVIDKALMSEGMSSASPATRTVTTNLGQMGPTTRFPNPTMPTNTPVPSFAQGFGRAAPVAEEIAPAANTFARAARVGTAGAIPAAPAAAPAAEGLIARGLGMLPGGAAVARAAPIARRVIPGVGAVIGVADLVSQAQDPNSSLNQTAAAGRQATLDAYNRGDYAAALGNLGLGTAKTLGQVAGTVTGVLPALRALDSFVSPAAGQTLPAGAAPAPRPLGTGTAGGFGPDAAGPHQQRFPTAQPVSGEEWARQHANMPLAQMQQLVAMAPKPKTAKDVLTGDIGGLMQQRFQQRIGALQGKTGAEADKARAAALEEYYNKVLPLLQGSASWLSQLGGVE